VTAVTGDKSLLTSELQDAWPVLSLEERLEGLHLFPRPEAEDFLLSLPARDQAELILRTSPVERRFWMRLLPLDDAADVIQAAPEEEREGLLALLDDSAHREVAALLAYAEDDAGGLMNPHFARLRPEMSVDEAIAYLRRQARERLETIYYVYVLDPEQRLLGVVTFRELFAAPPDKTVRDIMHTDVVTAHEEMDQEALSKLFQEHDFLAIPVLDDERRVKGIVTVDDIVDVVQEEATEDIQKIGGMEALEAPYLDVGFLKMIRKRGGWLSALFIGELLTASAMGASRARSRAPWSSRSSCRSSSAAAATRDRRRRRSSSARSRSASCASATGGASSAASSPPASLSARSSP
jgi:magnesium transporter